MIPLLLRGQVLGVDFEPEDGRMPHIMVGADDLGRVRAGEVVVVDAERWDALMEYVVAAERSLMDEGIGPKPSHHTVPVGIIEHAADLTDMGTCERWEFNLIDGEEHNATCTCPIARRARGETMRCTRCRSDIDADKISEPCTGTDWMDRHADPGPHTPEENRATD